MPAPTASVLDNFNRANAKPPSSSYTLGPIVFTAGNELRSSRTCSGKSNASPVTARTTSTTTHPTTGRTLRLCQGADNRDTAQRFAAALCADDEYRVGHQVAYAMRSMTAPRSARGVASDATRARSLRSAPTRPGGAIGDLVGFNVTGTGATVTIQFWYKASGGSWTQIGSDFTDTSGSRIVSAGKIGAGIIGFGAALDDLSVQTLTSGTVFTKALTATQGQAASLPKTPGKVLIP
jgi:hypothetical protein